MYKMSLLFHFQHLSNNQYFVMAADIPFSSILVPSCGVWNPHKLIRQHTYSRLVHSYTICRSAVSPSTVSRVWRRYREINQYNRRDSEALKGQQTTVRIAVCSFVQGRTREQPKPYKMTSNWPLVCTFLSRLPVRDSAKDQMSTKGSKLRLHLYSISPSLAD